MKAIIAKHNRTKASVDGLLLSIGLSLGSRFPDMIEDDVLFVGFLSVRKCCVSESYKFTCLPRSEQLTVSGGSNIRHRALFGVLQYTSTESLTHLSILISGMSEKRRMHSLKPEFSRDSRS